MADKDDFAPAQKITALNGRVFTVEALTDILKYAKGTSTQIEFLVQDEHSVAPVLLSYGEGLRYPRLKRG